MAFSPPTLGSETIAHIGSFPIRNSMLMAWVAMAILIIVGVIYRKKGSNLVPKGFQNFVESIIELLFNFFNSVTQDKKQARRFFPIVATIFLFVILSNWMGILPGVGPIGFHEKESEIHETVAGSAEVKGEEKEVFIPYFRSAYADVNMTLALAIISIIVTQIYGIASLGFFSYAGKFFVNPLKDPIGTFVGLLELVSEIAKVISFTFRLFGNIFAGEILLTVISFLVPYLAPLPFYGLEIFVGFVQALVFSVLTLVFMKGAVASHHKEAHA
ncbi:MAG: F0F1 ATP synthase subunit A [Patescibacteria group bacterium]